MKKLYHYPMCPLSRQIRIILKELDLTFNLIKEDYWLSNKNFLKINPAGTLPVLEESTNFIIAGLYPTIEYLMEQYTDHNLLDKNIAIKCEIRRLFWWFNDKFYKEVTKILIEEKIIRTTSNIGSPRSEYIKAAKNNLVHHLNYLADLFELRSFVASNNLSIADIAAASQISVIDYFGEINWQDWPAIHTWYAILKSRPSFRQILKDYIPGFAPSTTYADLDF